MDFGEWTIAFDSFADAFTFIFPHRREELQQYVEHVKSFFKARLPSEHSGVIAYDSAVRTHVGQHHDLLHTDFFAFQDLQIRFIFSPSGSAAGMSTRSVEAGTSTMVSVAGLPPPASTRMSAPNVAQEGMWKRLVKRNDVPPAKESLAEASLTMAPVPAPPPNELANHVALATIETFPHLFPIVTPVNVDRFETLLGSHPNRSLIQSICQSLHEGFWPWAVTDHGGYPDTYDNAEGYCTLTDPAHLAFARRQCAAEVDAG
ncbi:hypothetical protein FISHEDRAFT_69729 [Fistulina hepatica ATCC 64428]|uniref:Uncharacterized protein n=1 Tax=Fistulina hepatica ATCC 64428 TaxID=1128425 RepID=A0A0D7AMN4_9AGAR|nr:hypothetical protein FISHEDRAFT_69729 [Fistulina hepatica ATCC 64428]